MGIPKKRASPSGPAASAAREAIYGPRKTVPTVVLNAELAQSYMAHPKISRLSFTGACGVVIMPPEQVGFADSIRQNPVCLWECRKWLFLCHPTPGFPGAIVRLTLSACFRLRKSQNVIEFAYS